MNISMAAALAAADKFPSTGPLGDIEITPLIHSSVQIEFGGRVIQVDPWSAIDLSRAKPADLILVTDDPVHHLDVKAIQQLRKAGTTVIIPAVGKTQVPDGLVLANGGSTIVGGIRVDAIPAYDVKPGAPEHPKGKSNGYLVAIGGRRIYFSGVTECVPEVQALTDIDVAFLPMNIPVERMMPAAAAACVTAIKPKVVYIYHYDQDFAAKVGNPNARPQGVPGGLTVAQSLDAFADAIKGEPIDTGVRNGIRRSPIRWNTTSTHSRPCVRPRKSSSRSITTSSSSSITIQRAARTSARRRGSRDLTLMQARVYRALAAMRRLEFTEPLPWTKDSVYRWLTKTVRGVRFRADASTSSCCGPDGLITVRSAIDTSPDGSQFGFSLAITKSRTMPTDFRLLATFMQLLVHEARHNNGKPHTRGTKDRTIREMGAWGAAYTFQRWIAEKTEPGLVPVTARLDPLRAADQICTQQICSEACATP